MFTSLKQSSTRSLVEKSSIEFERYQLLWAEYRKDKELRIHQRWGQFLCNKLKLTEEQAPGLFYEPNTKKANQIFNEHFVLH